MESVEAFVNNPNADCTSLDIEFTFVDPESGKDIVNDLGFAFRADNKDALSAYIIQGLVNLKLSNVWAEFNSDSRTRILGEFQNFIELTLSERPTNPS